MSFGTIIGLAIGGAFLLEGMAWALFPGPMRDMFRQMMDAPRNMLQIVGLISFLMGSGIILLVMRFSG